MKQYLGGGDMCAGVVDGMDYVGCISPLHRLCFMQQYLLARAPRVENHIEDLGSFLRNTIMQMSASRLTRSLENSTMGAPYNWPLQVEFLKAAMSYLPYGAYISPYIGAVSLYNCLPLGCILDCSQVPLPSPEPWLAKHAFMQVAFMIVSCRGSLIQVVEAKACICA